MRGPQIHPGSKWKEVSADADDPRQLNPVVLSPLPTRKRTPAPQEVIVSDEAQLTLPGRGQMSSISPRTNGLLLCSPPSLSPLLSSPASLRPSPPDCINICELSEGSSVLGEPVH
ncbi:unnamed protein product [Pleuronectes platessa]|uniref:Uncharacterized protein n=1 Tax=Pleuronectes platessa TaxID=8262 RepID=A0A9N7TKT4_PLEPL|nr:unnamed protein product [Pleuronectes platessa]